MQQKSFTQRQSRVLLLHVLHPAIFNASDVARARPFGNLPRTPDWPINQRLCINATLGLGLGLFLRGILRSGVPKAGAEPGQS